MFKPLPVLLLAALLIIAGAWRIVEAGADDGWAAVCVGCLMLGAWLSVELHDRWDEQHGKKP